jgi:DNA-binding PadR family transcriptional regulator
MHKRDRFIFMNQGPGGPPFGGPFFNMHMAGGPGHFGGHFGHRRRMRRGDVRAAILLLLEESPRNGYQVMQELEQRSDGAWRPSPGSVYPGLQLLADEGLIRGETREGGTVYELTDAGRKHVEEHREQLGSPWEQAGADVPDGVRDLGRVLGEVAMATRQVMHTGNIPHAKAAAELLAETRKKLYGILAGD